jgi:hypothetical protein
VTVEVADVLDKAADLIDPAKGGRWIRGALTDNDGGRCMLGAIQYVAVKQWLDASWPWNSGTALLPATQRVEALLGEVLPAWNDQDCLDGHEAANVLRKAAEIERGEGGRSAGNSGQHSVLPTTRPPVLMGAESGWTDPRPPTTK